MTDPHGLLGLVRPHLRAVPPYVPVEPPEEVAKRLGIAPELIVKLDANENPYGPSPKAIEALAKARSYHIYPDPEQRRVREALSRYTGFGPEWLICGAGSDELIDLLVRLFVAPGEAIVNFPPTFSFYPFLAAIQDARVLNVQRRDDYSIDLEAALAAAQASQLIVATSPNNPTGTLISLREVEALLATGRERVS